MERRATGEMGCRRVRCWVVVMTHVGKFTGVGLPETLCVAAIEVHGGVVHWEANLPGFPIIEGFLDSSSYRGSLLCTLVPPSGGGWE